MLRTLLIDDEASARSRLGRLLEAHPSIAVVGEAADGLAALEVIERERPDLVFLDVQMPGLTGFEVLQQLEADDRRPLVVFVTAYEKYALEAFDANAVAYLLKPIDRAALARAVVRSEALQQNSEDATQERERVGRLLAEVVFAPRQIVARTSRGFRLLALQEVLFFRARGGELEAHLADEVLRVDLGLAQLQERLPQPSFFLARRGVLVNLERLREIQPYHRGAYVLLVDDLARTEIHVSERQSKELRTLLEGGAFT